MGLSETATAIIAVSSLSRSWHGQIQQHGYATGQEQKRYKPEQGWKKKRKKKKKQKMKQKEKKKSEIKTAAMIGDGGEGWISLPIRLGLLGGDDVLAEAIRNLQTRKMENFCSGAVVLSQGSERRQ